MRADPQAGHAPRGHGPAAAAPSGRCARGTAAQAGRRVGSTCGSCAPASCVRATRRVGRLERQLRLLMATCFARAWPPPSAARRPPPYARCGAAPPESAGRRLTRRVRAGDGMLMRLCRSFRRRRVRPNRARLRRWVLQWCLLVACKPTHGRSQGKIQS